MFPILRDCLQLVCFFLSLTAIFFPIPRDCLQSACFFLSLTTIFLITAYLFFLTTIFLITAYLFFSNYHIHPPTIAYLFYSNYHIPLSTCTFSSCLKECTLECPKKCSCVSLIIFHNNRVTGRSCGLVTRTQGLLAYRASTLPLS